MNFKNSSLSLAEVIQSGELSEQDYLAWAAETYNLPVVANDFFAAAQNFQLLIKNASHQWSESFFPVHEWDGLLYIACLEPQEIQITQKYCFVLGSPLAMKNLWNKMEKPVAALDFSSFAGKSEDAENKAQESIPATPVIETKIEATASLNFDNLSFAGDVHLEKPGTPEVQKITPPPVTAKPETSHTPALANEFGIPDTVVFTIDPAKKENLNFNPNISASNFNVPEITNVIKVGSKREPSFTSTKTIMPFPERSTQFSFVRTVFSDQIILEARGKIQEHSDPHQALISAFHILKDYYNKLMWAVRDQKGAAFPIACTSNWDFSEEAWNTPLNFRAPNPFRIAKLTGKPYHGPVYPNPCNDLFFKSWNSGRYPEVFTVVPIKLQGKIFAYFVGCEPGLHYNPVASLEVMQAACDELLKTFVNIHKDLNAKAA